MAFVFIFIFVGFIRIVRYFIAIFFHLLYFIFCSLYTYQFLAANTFVVFAVNIPGVLYDPFAMFTAWLLPLIYIKFDSYLKELINTLPAPHALCLTLAGLVVNGCNLKSIFTRRIKIVARFYWIIITSEIFICCKYYFVIKCLALFPWRAASRSCSYSCFIELVTFQSMSALHCCTNSL